ncbi:small multidrug resistance pump [Duganella sp. SG902]|uniref:SMR family transporter n=1 Tax=Duganella sp. SG902 TaxID=2587016 RepID=UPI00159D4E63|nr:SMR family transporter [Duganella sp. SG902]NVM78739.1 small multidrug resistance pump [Duganella sp. SG902]
MNTTPIAGYLWLVLASVASAAATFLIKMSSQAGTGINLARLAWLGGAGGAYVLGFVCYAIALARLEISLAYPFMTAVTIVMVTLLGTMLLQEALTPTKIIGLILIGAGAFVVAR